MKLIIIISGYYFLSLLLVINNSHADEHYFPQPADLYEAANKANDKNIPIIILISSIHCDYCKFIKREFLVPMIKSGEYKNKVILKVIEDDLNDEVIDFNNQLIDSGIFSERYSISFTPTMIIVDHEGNELTERIIGLQSEEYYGAFIDQAIENALTKIAIVRK